MFMFIMDNEMFISNRQSFTKFRMRNFKINGYVNDRFDV